MVNNTLCCNLSENHDFSIVLDTVVTRTVEDGAFFYIFTPRLQTRSFFHSCAPYYQEVFSFPLVRGFLLPLPLV